MFWFWFQSLLLGFCGGGAPSKGAETGTLRGSPECKHSLTRSWQPSFSMCTAIRAMLRESSRPQWGRPSYCMPRFSSIQISFVWERATYKRPAWALNSCFFFDRYKQYLLLYVLYRKHLIISFPIIPKHLYDNYILKSDFVKKSLI